MRNLFKYMGLFAVLLFSFYYTEKMSNIVVSNNSLVSEINSVSEKYNIKAVSAVIEDNYIIPGLNGYAVNVLKSYNNMRFLDTFNSYYLEYDKVLPNVSLENNKDKIIKKGNKNKKAIAIIVQNNYEIIDYSKNKKIKIDRLIDNKTYKKDDIFYEKINNDIEEYKRIESYLNNTNTNHNLCIVNNNLIEVCKSEKKYLIEPNKYLYNYNLASLKNNIESGDIIFINDSVSLTDYKLLLKQVYYQDLDVLFLSELISEER